MVPKAIEQGQIEDKAGAVLPLDVELIDHNGKKVALKDYFNESQDKPIILTIGYYECPMLCSLVLNGLMNGLKDLSFKPEKDFLMLSVSIDHRESVELADKKRSNYIKALEQSVSDNFWPFHIGDKEEVKRLADALGFNYFYDKRNDQFSHGAGVFVISPKGVLSRTLFGINFKPSDIKLALSEAADGKIGSFIDQVILSCFHYDPDSHKYGVYILGVMRLGGILTIIILGIVLFLFFRSDKKRMRAFTS